MSLVYVDGSAFTIPQSSGKRYERREKILNPDALDLSVKERPGCVREYQHPYSVPLQTSKDQEDFFKKGVLRAA